jgi:hypothetical protein
MNGWMYCLSNKSLPGLYKIGCTETADKTPEDRAEELSTTGIPHAFEIEYKCLVSEPYKKERIVHELLEPYRENQRREFFRCDLTTVIKLFELMDNKATPIHIPVKSEKSEIIITGYLKEHLKPITTYTLLEDIDLHRVALREEYKNLDTDEGRTFCNRSVILTKLHQAIIKEIQASSIVQVVSYDFLWAQFNLKKLKDIEKYRITKNVFINNIALNYEYDLEKDCIKNTGFFKNETTYKKYLDVINNTVYLNLTNSVKS